MFCWGKAGESLRSMQSSVVFQELGLVFLPPATRAWIQDSTGRCDRCDAHIDCLRNAAKVFFRKSYFVVVGTCSRKLYTAPCFSAAWENEIKSRLEKTSCLVPNIQKKVPSNPLRLLPLRSSSFLLTPSLFFFWIPGNPKSVKEDVNVTKHYIAVWYHKIINSIFELDEIIKWPSTNCVQTTFHHSCFPARPWKTKTEVKRESLSTGSIPSLATLYV